MVQCQSFFIGVVYGKLKTATPKSEEFRQGPRIVIFEVVGQLNEARALIFDLVQVLFDGFQFVTFVQEMADIKIETIMLVVLLVLNNVDLAMPSRHPRTARPGKKPV